VYGGGLQVLKTRDWYRIVIDATADKDRGAASTSLTVCPMANIVHEPEMPLRL
jgi:hypothetical protein